MFFWLENGLYELADKGAANVDAITARVNLHADSYGGRGEFQKGIFYEGIFTDI